jgi:DtxR family Mn-dependent transcriptional regulator
MTELTSTMKDYIKAIFFMEEEGKEAKTTDLAGEIKVKPASVTEMVQKLASMGLVHHDPYHGTKLTEKGKDTVTEIVRKHRLLEKLFVDFAGLDAVSACDEASRLELLLSAYAANRICATYEHPQACPCGKPIYSDERCCGKRT